METETTFQTILGQVIAKERESQNKDQEWLAKQVGVTRSAWSKVENGKTGIPSAMLIKAAKPLDTSASKLMAKAETVAKQLEDEKVKVHWDNKSAKKSHGVNGFVAFLGAAVLGALIVKALSNSDKTDSKR